MERMELIAPCHFGLEAVLKREIQDLGYEISNVEGIILWKCRGNLQGEYIFADRRESTSESGKF